MMPMLPLPEYCAVCAFAVPEFKTAAAAERDATLNGVAAMLSPTDDASG